MNILFQAAYKFTQFLSTITLNPEGEPKNGDALTVVDPIYDVISTYGPSLIALLAVVLSLYAAIMGFSYSKAETADERNSAKKKLVNGIIGFGVILILIVLLYALKGPISNLINANK